MRDDKRSLLWLDDDGPERFLHVRNRLVRAGYEVTWAQSGLEAAGRLTEAAFDVIFIDQELPIVDDATLKGNVWGGCLVLYWLRGRERPKAAPPIDGLDSLFALRPHPDNVERPVIFVSAFFDKAVNDAIRNLQKDIPVVRKPIIIEELLGHLNNTYH